MYLSKRSQRLTLSLWMSVHISVRTSVDETCRKEAIRPAELKAEDPWLCQVDLIQSLILCISIVDAGTRCEKKDVFTAEALVDLHVIAI